MEEKVLIPEEITTTAVPKGVDKTESIYPETIELPDYSYGNGQNTLDYDIALRNRPILQSKIYFGNSSRGSGGTGDQTITGVGFKPKHIQIQAIFSATPGARSDGQISESLTNTFVDMIIWNVTNYGISQDNTTIIYLRNDTGGWVTQAKATLTSMDDDGFTLNWSEINGTVIFKFQCFG